VLSSGFFRGKKGTNIKVDKEHFDENFVGEDGLGRAKMADFGCEQKSELINK